MKYGDPVDYIIKVYNRLHVGDTGIGKVMLLSIACQSVLNSEGLQPKLSGASGKGKTHAAKAMYHLMPDVGYKLEGSLVRMIRGVYKGKTIKTAGRILAEASSEPGRYAVREVIVILQ